MTLGSHQKTIGKSQVRLTPKRFIDALGPFGLDPCAANPRPWDCAARNYTVLGLDAPWEGVVGLNPPFDRRQVGRWVERLAQHGQGIALLHARTETAWFKPVWRSASAIQFLDRRIAFCDSQGVEAKANSGAPPVLCAFGADCAERLFLANLGGPIATEWTR